MYKIKSKDIIESKNGEDQFPWLLSSSEINSSGISVPPYDEKRNSDSIYRFPHVRLKSVTFVTFC